MKLTIKLLILYQLVLNLVLADTVTTPIRSMEGHKNRVISVVISPDGRYALTLDGFSMKLWKVSNGTKIRSFGEQKIWIGSIAISQDGRYVISGSRDKTMKLWDISNGTAIRSFKGFTNYVDAVALSPDGLSVLSGANNILNIMGYIKWD